MPTWLTTRAASHQSSTIWRFMARRFTAARTSTACCWMHPTVFPSPQQAGAMSAVVPIRDLHTAKNLARLTPAQRLRLLTTVAMACAGLATRAVTLRIDAFRMRRCAHAHRARLHQPSAPRLARHVTTLEETLRGLSFTRRDRQTNQITSSAAARPIYQQLHRPSRRPRHLRPRHHPYHPPRLLLQLEATHNTCATRRRRQKCQCTRRCVATSSTLTPPLHLART